MTATMIKAVIFVLLVMIMIWQVIHPLLNGENIFPIFRKSVDNKINTKENVNAESK
jgi:hypothetical protein